MRPTQAERRVSTHASAREATARITELMAKIEVSTHASAREATLNHSLYIRLYARFYPRLREGGDKRV